MLKSYVKVALRKMSRNMIFSVVNILGLVIGLACSMLIILYVEDELSFDKFHKNIDRIWQLTSDRVEKDGRDEKFAIAAMVQGPAFARSIPEIESFTRVSPKQATVRIGDNSFMETITWTDENFFTVFSFPLVNGQAKVALHDLHSVVLSETTAKKYFKSANVAGNTIQIEVNGSFEPFIISAVAKDAPENSSIQFNMVLPIRFLEQTSPDNGWMWVSYPTYFILQRGVNKTAIEKKMQRVYEVGAHDEIDMNHQAGYENKFIWSIHPFSSMHLNTEYKGSFASSDPLYSAILSAVAIFILLIAIFNFINLTLCGSLLRSKEIGVRKVMGSSRKQLAAQFLTESFVFCFLSFLVATGVLWLVLPLFNEFANKQIAVPGQANVQMFLLFIGLLFMVGFLAGCYPALVMSRPVPVILLQGKQKQATHFLKKAFVAVQFSVATFFILLVWVMFDQFHFLGKKELGYNDRDLVEFTVDKAVMDKSMMDAVAFAYARVPGVMNVGYGNIGRFGGKTIANRKQIDAIYERIDEGYLPALGAHFASGRNFSINFTTDANDAVLVNEAFVREAGWKDAVGQTVDYMNIPGWGDKKIQVAGVVKDYHSESLKEKIKPMIFTMDSHLPLGRFIVRLAPNNNGQTLQMMDKLFRSISPGHPFQYNYRKDLNQAAYVAENRWKRIMTCGALLTIIISCTGLFAITLFDTKGRTREIAIRKVLGASVYDLLMKTVWDFVKLVLLGFVLAAPFGFYAAHRWLQGFAYRVDLGWGTIAGPFFIILVLAMITTLYNAAKASLVNPVISLKQE